MITLIDYNVVEREKVDMIKDKIAEILYDRLDGVYCDTCEDKATDNDEYGGSFHPCWTCHKEQTNWQLSYECAEQLADKILNCVQGVDDENSDYE